MISLWRLVEILACFCGLGLTVSGVVMWLFVVRPAERQPIQQLWEIEQERQAVIDRTHERYSAAIWAAVEYWVLRTFTDRRGR